MLLTTLAVVGIAVLLVALCLARYNGYNAGMLDLGNMAQAIASVGRGQPLVFTYVDGPMSRLSLHVELFYYLLFPVYWLWPDPRSLLVAQVVLFVSGAFPAYRLATRSLQSPLAGLLAAICYLLYPVGQTAVLFDLHGDTLALPMLMFAIEALDRRAWRTYALFIALALACKFYIAAPVAALGPLIWWHYRARRAAILTSLAALLYGLCAFLLIRPLFTTGQTSEVHRGLNYVSFYFGQFDELLATLDQRLLSALAVFAPVLLLAWRGWPWLLPAAPLAAAALLSTGPAGSYDYRYHHFAVVVPFAIAALIAGARSVRERLPKRNWQADLLVTTLIVCIFNLALVDTPLNPSFWFGIPGQGRDHAMYGFIPRDQLKNQCLTNLVPPKAPLAASVFLASHLVERNTLYLVRYPDDPGGERLPGLLPEVEYVLADALFDWRVLLANGLSNGADYEWAEIAFLLGQPDVGLVATCDGLLLFQRNPPAEQILQQEISEQALPASPPQAEFGPLRLHRGTITPLGQRRYRAELVWSLSETLPPDSRYVAISQLVGTQPYRIVHLPVSVLRPPHTWQVGQAMAEQFEFTLPADLPPGTYEWQLSWHDLRHSEGYATDTQSLAFSNAPVILGTVKAP
jgi:uncharacterized membrane protein